MDSVFGSLVFSLFADPALWLFAVGIWLMVWAIASWLATRIVGVMRQSRLRLLRVCVCQTALRVDRGPRSSPARLCYMRSFWCVCVARCGMSHNSFKIIIELQFAVFVFHASQITTCTT